MFPLFCGFGKSCLVLLCLEATISLIQLRIFCNCWHLISNKRRQGVDVMMKLYTYMYQKFKIHNKAFGGPLSFCIICEEACPSQTDFG